MLRANSFAIHLTYTCPLTCKHCCFSSSPTVKDRLSPDQILALIQSLEGRGIDLLAFTGGEPFLFGQRLVDFVREGKRYANAVRVVTSAYWANSDEAAQRKIVPLAAAGLDQISISWDDYHEEFVDFQNVKRAFACAKQHGIQPAIAMMQSPRSRRTAARVKSELDGLASSRDIVVESTLNYTGRAERELKGSGVKASQHLGPCPYVLTGPTASAKGKLLACCGVIPETPDLVLSESLEPKRVWSAVDEALNSPLLRWIHLRGPYAVMEYISNKYGIAIPPPNKVGGNCEACKLLFTTESIRSKIPEAVSEMEHKISGEVSTLEALGLLDGMSHLPLWQDSMISMEEKENA